MMDGAELKAQGMAAVATSNQKFLNDSRAIARKVLLVKGLSTMYEVRRVCERRGIFPKHQNAWGAVFSHPDFATDGTVVLTKQVEGHRNKVLVWHLTYGKPSFAIEKYKLELKNDL